MGPWNLHGNELCRHYLLGRKFPNDGCDRQAYASSEDESREIKTKWVYQIPFFRRSLVTMEEGILVVLWAWKPDCSGLKSEWEARKRRQQTWTPFQEIWMRGGGKSFIPLKGPFHLLEKVGKEILRNMEGESDIPQTLRMHQGGKVGIGNGLRIAHIKLPSLKTSPLSLPSVYPL